MTRVHLKLQKKRQEKGKHGKQCCRGLAFCTRKGAWKAPGRGGTGEPALSEVPIEIRIEVHIYRSRYFGRGWGPRCPLRDAAFAQQARTPLAAPQRSCTAIATHSRPPQRNLPHLPATPALPLFPRQLRSLALRLRRAHSSGGSPPAPPSRFFRSEARFLWDVAVKAHMCRCDNFFCNCKETDCVRVSPLLRKSTDAGTIILVLSLLPVPLLLVLSASPAQADGVFVRFVLIMSLQVETVQGRGMIYLLLSFCGDLISAVTRPWRQLFWLVLHLYVSVCSVVLNRISGAFSRCIEVVTAYRREKELVVRLNSVRHDYEDLKLKNNELQRKLDAFTRDRRRILETLDLVTDEKKRAMETVRFLKNKVQDLEFVNKKLAESEELERRGLANTVATLTGAAKLHSERKYLEQDSISKISLEHDSLVQAKDLASKTLHDVLIKDPYLEPIDEMQSLLSHENGYGHLDLKDIEVPLITEADQGVAFISSIFSAVLSTMVAAIAWEAKDPCTPLVVALFTVVGMSLVNVVRFFHRIQSHQGFLAVALLSLNWFMLGTLAHPALPYLGRFGSATVWIVSHRFIQFIGFGNAIRVKVNSHDEL